MAGKAPPLMYPYIPFESRHGHVVSGRHMGAMNNECRCSLECSSDKSDLSSCWLLLHAEWSRLENEVMAPVAAAPGRDRGLLATSPEQPDHGQAGVVVAFTTVPENADHGPKPGSW